MAKGWGGIKNPGLALITPSPVLITPFPANALPNKLAISLEEIHLFVLLLQFLIVSLIPFTNNPDSWNYLTIFVISFISSFEITNVVDPDPWTFF